MMMKTLATQALTAALFFSAYPVAFSQATPPADNAIKPAPQPPSTGTAKTPGKASRRTGVATIDDADFVTTTPEPGVAPPPVKRATSSRFVVAREREDIPPLVVQFSGKNETNDSLHEELTITTVRIRKSLEGTADEDALAKPGNAFFRANSSGSVRTMYLEGFGAVVFVKVGFPLLGAAAPEQAASEPAETEWNRAKQELLAEKRKSLVMDVVMGQPYDAAQVETLKNQILSALKDATNIRSIKPGDLVAVTVFGPPAAVAGK